MPVTDQYYVRRGDGSIGPVVEFTDDLLAVHILGENGTALTPVETTAHDTSVATERDDAASDALVALGVAVCEVTTDPADLTLNVGDPVAFGEVVNGEYKWQTGPAAVGPWEDADLPLIAAIPYNGTYWRVVCLHDETVVSNAALITVTGGCQILVSPSNQTGDIGDPTAWAGAANGSIDWYYSTTGSSGPWIAQPENTPPATITAADDGKWFRFCCRDAGLPTDPGAVCSIPALLSVDGPPQGPGYSPANFDTAAFPIRTTFPDPYEDRDGQYTTRSAVVPQVKIRTGLFTHPTRPSALTTSSMDAGVAYTDPLLHPGVVGGPVAAMDMSVPHEHWYHGNRLSENANLLDLANEPLDFMTGSNAAEEGFGFRTLITDGNGNRFGYSPGIWWPRIYYQGNPMTHKKGIAVYYVRQPAQVGERLFLLPNGAGFVITDPSRISLNDPGNNVQDWRFSIRGPLWFHPDIHLGPFPPGADNSYNDQFLEYGPTKPGPEWVATPQFQTYIKVDLPNPEPPFQTIVNEGGFQGPRFHYGNPTDIGIQFHVDYVAGWTNQAFAQELIDRTANRNVNNPQLNIKFEGWKPTWDESGIPPAPPDLGA